MEFNNLLATITGGQSSCLNYQSGYCVLPSSCASYPDLWTYDFKAQFSTDSDTNYIRIPLATFAKDYTQEDGVCVIYVEYLEQSKTDSKYILLGGMFFQSFYAQYQLFGVSGTTVNLFVNKNALPMTYLGNAVVPTGPNPFVVAPVVLKTDTLTSRNGLPTFNPTMAGVGNANAYFLMDFTADYTLLWNKNCTTTGFGGYNSSSCELAPTLMNVDFDPTDNSTGLIH